jgi:hypothetical protein
MNLCGPVFFVPSLKGVLGHESKDGICKSKESSIRKDKTGAERGIPIEGWHGEGFRRQDNQA